MSASDSAGGTGSVIESLKFNEQGLIPAIVQDDENGQVLMMAWMNAEALRRTIESGQTCFWSRSRQEYWVKGLTSGHTQKVRSLHIDCDRDVVLVRVQQVGAACHEGYRTCFYRRIDGTRPDAVCLTTTEERVAQPS
ncbi:MAG TPA: phosphoribosyl-AMP cyclohydrolase [Armatimonadota bacterium]|mgnify:CR=1 FL=1|nr:phosphoribosyl-AMP cyclohydrolase [Armatimonadota bacterium]HQK94592.1 phosphoribosyl-AMP cyclohydrolase [Armatimonadota bacterium]